MLISPPLAGTVASRSDMELAAKLGSTAGAT